MAKLQLGIVASDVRGRAGNVVITKNRYGLAVRPYIVPNDPRTPAQIESRNRFAVATTTFKSLTTEQVEAWKNYANSLPYNDPITAKRTSPTAIAAFTALATKYLQIQSALANPASPSPIETSPSPLVPEPSPKHPASPSALSEMSGSSDASPIENTPPLVPPSSPLYPDDLTLDATPIENAVRITASAPNSENVYTEILLQPLPSWGRAPKRHLYRTAAFVHFTPGQPADIPAQPGITAIAYRFAKSTTGQQTELIQLQTIQVP